MKAIIALIVLIGLVQPLIGAELPQDAVIESQGSVDTTADSSAHDDEDDSQVAEVKQCVSDLLAKYGSRSLPEPVRQFGEAIIAATHGQGLYAVSEIDADEFDVWVKSVSRPAECNEFGANVSEELEEHPCFSIEKSLDDDFSNMMKEALSEKRDLDLFIGSAFACANSRPATADEDN